MTTLCVCMGSRHGAAACQRRGVARHDACLAATACTALPCPTAAISSASLLPTRRGWCTTAAPWSASPTGRPLTLHCAWRAAASPAPRCGWTTGARARCRATPLLELAAGDEDGCCSRSMCHPHADLHLATHPPACSVCSARNITTGHRLGMYSVLVGRTGVACPSDHQIRRIQDLPAALPWLWQGQQPPPAPAAVLEEPAAGAAPECQHDGTAVVAAGAAPAKAPAAAAAGKVGGGSGASTNDSEVIEAVHAAA